MTDKYLRDVLRISVGQICQTIGYTSTQGTPLAMMQDVLHRYLLEFTRDLRRTVEAYNRQEPTWIDVADTMQRINVDISELLDYMQNVEPVPFPFEMPKFPMRKENSLNFLKPGSNEVLTRPVHIFEYLPPTLPPDPNSSNSASGVSQTIINGSGKTALESGAEIALNEEKSKDTNINKEKASSQLDGNSASALGTLPIIKRTAEEEMAARLLRPMGNNGRLDGEGRPTRELRSVVMTTGGFISPAIEGKLPEILIPQLEVDSVDMDNQPSTSNAVDNKIEGNKATAKTERDDISAGKAKHQKSSLNAGFASMNAGSLVSNTGSGTTAMANKNLAGPHGGMHFPQGPNVASRLLKKAKKKSSNFPFMGQGRVPRTDKQDADVIPGGLEPTEKVKRKSMKMLQKLSKSNSKAAKEELMRSRSAERDNKIAEYLMNPSKLAALPPGPERVRIEKLLKKQFKHKQKMLKQKQNVDMQANLGEMKPVQLLNTFNTESGFPNDSGNAIFDERGKLKAERNEGTKSADLTGSSKLMLPQNSLLAQAVPDAMSIGRGGKHIGGGSKNESLSPTQVNVVDKKTSMEIKLSNEPDPSKLNIFKKISKPKYAKTLAPSAIGGGNRISPISLYANNESPVINLPSGTTITPAPLPVQDEHASLSTDKDGVALNDSMDKGGGGAKVLDAGAAVTAAPLLTFGSNLQNPENKPKKRGRKPGSKNHAKLQPPAAVFPVTGNTPGQRKSKKFKQQNIELPGFRVPISTEPNSEPLNLSSPSQFGTPSDFPGNFAMQLAKPYPMNKQTVFQAQGKERKERKKTKMKNFLPEQNNLKGNMNLNVPTTEEVNSINQKLKRMDTVLQPAPPMQGSNLMPKDLLKNVPELPKDKLLSPGKEAAPAKITGSKKRTPAPNPSLMFPPTPFIGPPGAGGLGFSNLTPGIIPMMPLYPFPRPGLIPAPGLYPTPGLTNFSANVGGAGAPNMLIPGMLPLPNLKPSHMGKLSAQETDKADNPPKLPTSSTERNYSKVAPLVPDFMQMSPRTELEKSVFAEQGKLGGSKIRQSPLPHNDPSNATKPDLLNVPESGAFNNNAMPVTPGGLPAPFSTVLSKKTDDAESNDLFSSNITSSQKESVISKPRLHVTAFANLNEPIEVSDDSDEASPTVKQKSNSSLVKPPVMPPSGMHAHGDMFASNKPVGGTPDILMANTKKIKKMNKFEKKAGFLGPGATNLPIDIFENRGVGKLAGGADLIPLTGTGLAYSAKSIPSTSLTATPASNFQMPKRDFGPTNIFDNITITPTTVPNSNLDLQKKRKEHKKLKKLKDGKIKKKKDKKDKSKSKEHAEKYLHKMDKEKDGEKYKNKDLIKKMKKEKKKEKQRNSFEVSPSSSANVIGRQNLLPSTSSDGARDKPTSSLQSIPTDMSSHTAQSTPATVVPKLTLKLGTGQSPTPIDDAVVQKMPQTSGNVSFTDREKERDRDREPSPELARISPLVTRPPKQKSSSQYMGTGGSSTQSVMPPPNPWLSGGTLTASSVLLPQQLLQAKNSHDQPPAATELLSTASSSRASTDSQGTVPLIGENNRISSYVDEEGVRIWICPACGKVDDGSPMIGCDGCDAWYHWVCVGIVVEPTEKEMWFCRVCITRKKGVQGQGQTVDKKRNKRKRKGQN